MGKRICSLVLSFVLMSVIVVPVWATTISDVKNKQQQTQRNINQVNNQIEEMETQKDAAAAEVENLNLQLVDILTSIQICEEEIEIKQKEIDLSQKEVDEAEAKELGQYEDMKKRIKFMYEQGDRAYVQALLGAADYSEMVNKADYVEQLYNYDRELLAEYVRSKELVEQMKEILEDEQAALEASEYELEQEQKALEQLVKEKEKTIGNFEARLAEAQEQVAAYKEELQEQTAQIKKLEREEQERQEEERRRQQAALNRQSGGNNNAGGAADNDYSAGAAGGGGGNASKGQEIANYACQFVGNPYVYGGTSLTNGTDCSGFTQSVFAHFGISIPRDSYSQRSCGTGVSYADARAGDIICYAGHVALYLGNGKIVHASTERTGITYGTATYRTILSVRRVV